MASIKKRRNKLNVVYYFIDEHGERRQKWEAFDTEAEARKRKSEVEYKQQVRTFIPPSKLTVAKFWRISLLYMAPKSGAPAPMMRVSG